MATWHLALRILGLRDRAERKALPRPLPYRLLTVAAVVCCVIAGVLAGNSHWLIGGALFAGGLVALFAAEMYRDREYLGELRRSSRR